MSERKVNCPYCDKVMRINHEYDFEEDELYEALCRACDKSFVYSMTISIDFSVRQADCLNGEPHCFKKTKTLPECAARLRCPICGAEKPIPVDELCPKRDKCGDNCLYKGDDSWPPRSR